ncbi:shugoshin [Teladorsagia circumcincta]|uniref:Shugoshin n=1 Tax=Teladorsagia circumcincta TaxID=45464 RepID=A0A2G9UTZ1_TELCI|nr:shugoshin [Teladorsagia circumcincta]
MAINLQSITLFECQQSPKVHHRLFFTDLWPANWSSTRDMLRDHYAKTNQSLVLKIHYLEVELARSRKLNDELRNENEMLRKRMAECSEVDSPGRIEALIEERLKRKMEKLDCISRRMIASLHKSASTLKDAFEDFGIELMSEATHMPEEGNDPRKRLTDNGRPRLSSVSESPPLVTKSQETSKHIENRENNRPLGDGETPTGTQTAGRPRRSELFGRSRNVHITDSDEKFSQIGAETSPCLGEKVETLETPPVNSKRPILDTPAVPWMETDTVRRKRTATLKIKTLVEPKLNSKLRRPGRNDEPHPFVSSNI